MKDSRSLYARATLGDALSDTLASLNAAQTSAETSFGVSVLNLQRTSDVHPSPYTDYSQGMLNGWSRFWHADGSYSVGPSPYSPGTNGPAPSAQDWQNFDAVANSLGVGGAVAADRASSMRASSNLFDKIGAAINTALVQIDQNVTRPVVHTTAEAVAVLDHYVPGWATLIDALYPVLPFVPAITAALSAASGVSTALVGQAFDSIATGVSVADRVAPVSQFITPLTSGLQNEISNAVAYAAKVGTTNAQAVANVQASLGKALATAATTRGNAINGLEAAGIEAAQGVILALQVAASVASGGSSIAAGGWTVTVLQALALSLKASVTAAQSTGDPAQIMEAVGLTIAKGLPALLGGLAAALPLSVAGTPVEITTETIVVNGQTVTTQGLTTTLGAIVRGVASLESSILTTGVGLAQIALANRQLVDAAKASRAAVAHEASDLDAQIAALQRQLAALRGRSTGQPLVDATVNASPLVKLGALGLGAWLLGRLA